MTRLRGRRPSGDGGGSTLDYVGTLALVVLLLGAVLAAYLANSGTISSRTASRICQILTLGQGDCGGSTTDDTRQPDEPCVVKTDETSASVSVAVTYVEGGLGRSFAVEERSDGSFRVTTQGQLDGGVTAGVGGHTSVTVDDNTVAAGAAAGVSAGGTVSGGLEWIVHSRQEADQIMAADRWHSVDVAASTALPGIGAGLALARNALGIGETYPPPDSIYVEGGATTKGNAGAGAGIFASSAGASASKTLGFRVDTATGDTTYYFETTVEGSASAEVAAVPNQDWKNDQAGAGLSGEATLTTAVTVDAKGNLVSGSVSGLAAGQSAGLTNTLFGGDPTAYMSKTETTGTQWDATLRVRSDADREAVIDMMRSANINPATIGQPSSAGLNVVGGPTFLEAVRDRGDLTRYNVAMDDTTPFAASGEVSATAKVSVGLDSRIREMTASDPQYWNGRAFADRTNC